MKAPAHNRAVLCPGQPDPAGASPADPSLQRFRRLLGAWFAANARPLPWRDTRDPYRIWVSEVMLQQTQVQTVVPYYHRFLQRFPDVHSLAEARLEAVLKVWEGLGYYGRARNLHHAAKAVVADHGGVIPADLAEFRKLKGVGEYIGSAVTSIAFDAPHAVVDGNVKRVLARFCELDAPVNRPGSHARFRDIARKLLDPEHPGMFNQAVMELGALVCRPKNPGCTRCPLNEGCGAYASGAVHRYPKRDPRARTPEYPVAVGVVRKNGRLLITRRKPDGLLGGLWEFPGGKVREGEAAEQACIREIAEETGLRVTVLGHLTRVKHAYTHFRIEMDVFVCAYVSGTVHLKGPVDHRWIALDEIHRFPFPGANRKFIPLLMQDDAWTVER